VKLMMRLCMANKVGVGMKKLLLCLGIGMLTYIFFVSDVVANELYFSTAKGSVTTEEQVLFEEMADENGQTLFVKKEPLFTYEEIVSIEIGEKLSDDDKYLIAFQLKPDSINKIEKLFNSEVETRFAIVLNRKLLGAPFMRKGIIPSVITATIKMDEMRLKELKAVREKIMEVIPGVQNTRNNSEGASSVRMEEQGDKLIDNGDYKQAITWFIKLHEQFPDNPTYYEKIGFCYFLLKDYKKAIDNLCRARQLTAKENQWKIVMMIAKSYQLQGDRRRAVLEMEKEIKFFDNYLKNKLATDDSKLFFQIRKKIFEDELKVLKAEK